LEIAPIAIFSGCLTDGAAQLETDSGAMAKGPEIAVTTALKPHSAYQALKVFY
jgi:hypothetical protein